jgi:hypothetical protein
MTAKQLLIERIEALTEEEAVQALELLDSEFMLDDDREREFPPAPAHIIALARKAIAEADAGRLISDEEFGGRLGID